MNLSRLAMNVVSCLIRQGYDVNKICSGSAVGNINFIQPDERNNDARVVLTRDHTLINQGCDDEFARDVAMAATEITEESWTII